MPIEPILTDLVTVADVPTADLTLITELLTNILYLNGAMFCVMCFIGGLLMVKCFSFWFGR